MPVKFFQQVQLSNGNKQATHKLQVGDSLTAVQVHQGETSALDAANIAAISGDFPEKPWQGVKISWQGGSAFCSLALPILTANGEWKSANKLQVGDTLWQQDAPAIPVTSVERGKVLCGLQSITLENQQEGTDLAFYYQGIWVGDDSLEKSLHSQEKLESGEQYIFPKNPVNRFIRRQLRKWS